MNVSKLSSVSYLSTSGDNIALLKFKYSIFAKYFYESGDSNSWSTSFLIYDSDSPIYWFGIYASQKRLAIKTNSNARWEFEMLHTFDKNSFSFYS